MIYATVDLRGSCWRGDAAVYACNSTRHIACSKRQWRGRRWWLAYGAVRNTVLAGPEVGRITGNVPAIRVFTGTAEIVRRIVGLPWLGGRIVHDAIDLPTFQQLTKSLDARNV